MITTVNGMEYEVVPECAAPFVFGKHHFIVVENAFSSLHLFKIMTHT